MEEWFDWASNPRWGAQEPELERLDVELIGLLGPHEKIVRETCWIIYCTYTIWRLLQLYIYIQYMFISILYCIMLYYITYSIHCCRLQRSFRFDQRRASRNPPRRCWHVRSWLVIQGWKGVGHTRFGPFRSFGCFFKGNLAVASNLVPIESGKSEKMHRFCYWELSSCRAFFTYHTPPDWCECQVLKRSLFIFVWDTRVEQLWRL